MGFTYSYDIICRREQLWNVLEAAAVLSLSQLRQQTVTLRMKGQEVKLPFDAVWGQELVSEGLPIKEITFGINLFFTPDKSLLQSAGDHARDEQGRISLGFYGSITTPEDFTEDDWDEDLSSPESIDAGDVRIQFQAPTTHMSLMFETSTSMRQTFVRLAQSQEHTICLFARESDGGVLLWLEDHQLVEEVEEPWTTREGFHRHARANEIARDLRRRTEHRFSADVFAEAVADREAPVRAAAIRELGSKSCANRDLIAQALLDDPSIEVRRCAAQALGQFPTLSYSSALKALENAALHDEDTEVRCAACRALKLPVSWNDGSTAMLAMLKDKSKTVRWAAADVLAPAAQAHAIPALIDALSDEIVAGRIAVALGRLRALDAVDPLCQLLDRDRWKDEFCYSSSIGPITEALANIGDRRAVTPLIHLLQMGECWGRNAAASALGVLGDSRAAEPLTVALHDPDTATKGNAVKSLERIKRLMAE